MYFTQFEISSFVTFAFPYNVKEIPLPPSLQKSSKSILFSFLGSFGQERILAEGYIFHPKFSTLCARPENIYVVIYHSFSRDKTY